MRAHLGLCAVLVAFAAGCAADNDDESDDNDDTVVDPIDDGSHPDPEDLTAFAATVPVLRGVDRAGVFSTGEARLLKRDHGVRWTGVYIGGACNGGSGWTHKRVNAIYNATKWRFMPIWVGQQSPAICGAHTLTRARGHADGVEAAARMTHMGWGAHKDIPVALDLEANTYEHSPSGATAYVRAWIAAVHNAGYRAYVYSSPSGIIHFHDHHVKADGAWVAAWPFRSGFHNVTPGDLTDIGRRYVHHNRAWQYAGDFSVSGAGRVDADTSHLLLAPHPGGTNRRVTLSQRAAPSSCSGLAPGEGLARGESLTSCDGHTTMALGVDGNLTVTHDGAVVWTANTDGAGDTALFGIDGNLVVYDATGEAVFDAGTEGNPDAQLELRPDGFAIVDADGGDPAFYDDADDGAVE